MSARNPRVGSSRAPIRNRGRIARRGEFPMDITLGPDVALRYIRTHQTAVEEDKENFADARAVGWEPVTVEELPEMAAYADENGYVRVKGTILCKNSAETVQEFNAECEREALAQARALEEEYEDSEGDGIKTHFKSSKRVSTRVVSAK